MRLWEFEEWSGIVYLIICALVKYSKIQNLKVDLNEIYVMFLPLPLAIG